MPTILGVNFGENFRGGGGGGVLNPGETRAKDSRENFTVEIH